MPIQSKIKVIKFTYRNGTEAYRVTGSVEGKQVRKNFKTRKEALKERDRLEVERLNGETDGQSIWTTLSRDQNRDAIAAVSKLAAAGSDKTLSFAVDFMLKHYRETESSVALDQAVTAYRKQRELEEARGIISPRQLKSIQSEMAGLKLHFGARPLSEITDVDLGSYLQSARTGNNKVHTGFSMKTWNNRRGLLSTFFKFCYKEKWVTRNPVEDLTIYKVKHRRATAETLTAKQAQDLMAYIETYTGPKDLKRKLYNREPGFLVPFFALALFAGVRPDLRHGEIRKLRAKNIDLQVGVIRIEPDISKVNERRIVKIQPNLKAWLEKYPLPESGAVPMGNPDRILADVRKTCNLGHDVLRHTFISMLVGAFKSVGDAALQAGNSEAVIRRHYLDLKSEEEAKAFWDIRPGA